MAQRECSRFAPMKAGLNPRHHQELYVPMVTQFMFAQLAGFLRDLRFPPAFKIGVTYLGELGSCCKMWMLQSKCYSPCAVEAAWLDEAT